MKILHTADIHLGAKNGKLSSDRQAQMKSEALVQIQDLFDVAKNGNYDVMLICGDLFHSSSITNKTKKVFFESVKEFGKPVLYINGNHDEFFVEDQLLPQNFIFLSEEKPSCEIDDAVFWTGVDATYISENFDKKKKNILLLHGNIENSKDYDFVDISKYKEINFDYVAMGHTHTYKVFNFAKTPYVYSGSLFSNGFDECGEKGFVSVELGKETKFEFVPFAKRKYLSIECDISDARGYYSILNKIRQILLNSSATNSDLIRIVLTGEYDEDLDKNLTVISQTFNHFFYFEMVDKSKIRIDLEKFKNEVFSFKAEFINLVKNSSLTEEVQDLICKLGIESLNGEDLSI